MVVPKNAVFCLESATRESRAPFPDDGSAWYNTSGNVLIYAQYGMKSDFGGWQQVALGRQMKSCSGVNTRLGQATVSEPRDSQDTVLGARPP